MVNAVKKYLWYLPAGLQAVYGRDNFKEDACSKTIKIHIPVLQ